MSGDDLVERPTRVHDHIAAQADDWPRARLLLSLLLAEIRDEWPTNLARELAYQVMLLATVQCGIEVGPDDEW